VAGQLHRLEALLAAKGQEAKAKKGTGPAEGKQGGAKRKVQDGPAPAVMRLPKKTKKAKQQG
jgi:hypothetical protein